MRPTGVPRRSNGSIYVLPSGESLYTLSYDVLSTAFKAASSLGRRELTASFEIFMMGDLR